jgi:rhamnosyltransferase
MTPPRVSIVIPTFNGLPTLRDVLDAIAAQAVDFGVEVVAVDSGSSDGTVELLRARGHRMVSISPGAFDHGEARNTGVRHSSGDLIVLLVQDAVPVSDRWLRALIAPFGEDRRLAGTFARQRPRPDASPLTRFYLSRYLAASPEARLAAVKTPEEFQALHPTARLERCTFDNVCACIRRTVWEQHPFRATPIGEDVAWARDVLLAGYRLAYVPEAEVVHSHDRSPRYEFLRTRILHFQLFQLFELRTIPNLPLLARAMVWSLLTHWKHDRGLRSLGLAFAWPLGQYLGALAAARGRRPPQSRAV